MYLSLLSRVQTCAGHVKAHELFFFYLKKKTPHISSTFRFVFTSLLPSQSFQHTAACTVKLLFRFPLRKRTEIMLRMKRPPVHSFVPWTYAKRYLSGKSLAGYLNIGSSKDVRPVKVIGEGFFFCGWCVLTPLIRKKYQQHTHTHTRNSRC